MIVQWHWIDISGDRHYLEQLAQGFLTIRYLFFFDFFFDPDFPKGVSGSGRKPPI